jgi:exodeoxyribonuclease VII small subunit
MGLKMSKITEPPMTFEEQMRQLEILVNKLEEGKLSLEDSITTYEKAMELVRQCGIKLEQAQKRVNVLSDGKETEYAL